jgi:hypothetical protein
VRIEYQYDKCKGVAISRKIRVGDVIQPLDGSGMPNVLHTLLWNGVGIRYQDLPLSPETAFKPVRVLSIEGDMLAVVPLYWDNFDAKWKDWRNDEVRAALSYVWKTQLWNHSQFDCIAEKAFWIHGPASNPILQRSITLITNA